MKALRVAVGLVYDDPWLFWGTLISLAFLRTALAIGLLAGAGAGIALAVLMFATILVSVSNEVRKKRRSSRA